MYDVHIVGMEVGVTKSVHVLSLLLVSVAMATALAHALELPGKLRLDKAAYMTVQPIYYPGFTFGGLVGEFGGMLSLAALLFFLPWAGAKFWWVAGALAAALAAHAVYWVFTHPVNGFWLADQDLSALGSTFFSAFSGTASGDWTALRDVWEYSHVARAALFMLSLAAVAIALAI